MSDIRHYSGM